MGELYGVRATPLPPNRPLQYNGALRQNFITCRLEKDGAPLSLAALWEHWDPDVSPLETFTIITTAASEGLADIHHRPPAIIEP